MATHTVNIDVIDKTIPIGNNRVIPVINQPNPALGYAASANEVAQLLRLANYYVYEAGTNTIINPYNYYDYFPEAGGGGGGGGGGVTPQTVQSMIDASIDSTVSETSTKAVQNAAITNFVNSSIESSTAEFKGTYDSKAEMDEVTANQNDYAFLRVLNNDGSVNHYERYKWSNTEVSGSHWLFEYNVNNSSFTAEQWAAINSGIKDTDVSALGGHVNNTNNPHNVTKAQVGLSDVDNTSDADKPISTATQTALNTKFDTAGTGLNKNGTTVSHATPEGAATHVKAFYKFSTDALGHVNGVTEATEAEVDAIDSGITAEKVGQIETNKNNILTVADQTTQYNKMNIVATTTTIDGVTFTVNVDKSITITGSQNNPSAHTKFILCNYTATSNLILYAPESVRNKYFVNTQDGVTTTNGLPEGAEITGSDIGTARDYQIVVIAGTSNINVTMHPMIIPKDIFNAGFTDYQPYALPNTELTNNILTVADQSTQYNLINLHNPIAVRNVVPTYLSDGGVTLDVNDAKWTAFNISFPAIVGVTYKFVVRITATTGFSVFNVFIRDTDGEGTNVTEYPTGISNAMINSVGTHVFEFTATATTMWIGFYPNNSSTVVTGSVTMKAQVIEKSLYDAGFTEYQPYALSNAELTKSVLWNTQSGVKNLLNIPDGTYTITGLTVVAASGELTFTSTNATAHAIVVGTFNLKAGTYVLSDRAGGAKGFAIRLLVDGETVTPTVETATFTLSADKTVEIRFYSYATISNQTIKPMLCPKSLYDADPTYQPYALSNTELTNNISITDITANFTAATGYTIQPGISTVYKQGKHVFGTLSVKIDSGNLPTTNTTIATNNTDKPNSATLMPCGCGIDAWSINSIGTCYYSQYTGEIKCSDTVSTNTCFNLQLNYVTF